MHERTPYLWVRPPGGGEDARVELPRERVTVGRAAPGVRPDVVLEPDPQQWVGRIHCVFEVVDGIWSVFDNATVNGTFLRRDDVVRTVTGPVRLQHGDVVMVLGDLTDGTPQYWQLRLVDPFTTRPAPVGVTEPRTADPGPARCEYDWIEARLHRVDERGRTEVTGLPPKAHQLIRYMHGQNQRNRGAAVVCTHEDLRKALWGDPSEWPAHRAYTDQDVRDVVYQARQRLESGDGAPRLLQTVRGLGYRLHSRPDPVEDGS